jgi:hypothetical protein
MHRILQTLENHSGELIHELEDEVGLTEAEATVFLREAAPELLASYVWQSSRRTPEELESPSCTRDLLASMSGARLASRVGLSSARTWDGLRALVPAVLRAAHADEVRARPGR